MSWGRPCSKTCPNNVPQNYSNFTALEKYINTPPGFYKTRLAISVHFLIKAVQKLICVHTIIIVCILKFYLHIFNVKCSYLTTPPTENPPQKKTRKIIKKTPKTHCQSIFYKLFLTISNTGVAYITLFVQSVL